MEIENKETCNRESSLSDDVAAVFNIIKEFRANQLKMQEAQKSTNSSKLLIPSIIFTVISILIITVLLFFLPQGTFDSTADKIRFFGQLGVIGVYCFGGVMVLSQYSSIKSFFKDPAGDLWDDIRETTSSEVLMFEKLDSLSIEAIEYTSKKIHSSSTNLDKLRSFLVGAIDKVGVVPGLVASALAISKVSVSGGFSWVEVLSVMLLGFYIMMFPLMEASMVFKRYSLILNEYLEGHRKTKGLTNC